MWWYKAFKIRSQIPKVNNSNLNGYFLSMPLMRLLFTDLPDEKPRITGIKEKYQIGERLEALCTSWQSHPPANLTWWINEEKVMVMMMMMEALCTSWQSQPPPNLGDQRGVLNRGLVKIWCFRDYHWKSDGDIVDFMARIIGKIWVSWDNLGSDNSRFLNGVKSKSPPNPKNWWNRDCYLSSYLGWLVGNTNLVCHFIFLLCVVWENKK